jgi:molybdenum cofactor synthesis domain-containing protein
MPGIDQSRQFVPLKIAVLTVSDTREASDDKSGATLIERIRAAGHVVAERAIVKDEVKTIRQHVKAWIADKFIDVVITTGGTGFTGRDVTPEAVEPLFEKKMDGFATMFLLVSRRRQCDLHFLPAGFARRVPRCLGRNLGSPARLPLPALQFRGDLAEARRASAAAEGKRGYRLELNPFKRSRYARDKPGHDGGEHFNGSALIP